MTILDALRAIAEARPGALDDVDMLRSLLLDRCPEQAPEVNRLVAAAREGVPEALRRADDASPRSVVVAGIAARLSHDLGLSEDASRWAVETWYDVLVAPAATTNAAPDTTPTPGAPIDTGFYRRASNDLWRNRQTDAASRLMAEIRADMRRGRSARDVQDALLNKGAPRVWTAAFIYTVDREMLRETLVAAAGDLAAGNTASANVNVALRLAAGLLTDDPRVPPLVERLKAAGCNDDLVAFLLSHETTTTTQRTQSKSFLTGGLVVTVIGIVIAWMTGVDDPQNSAMRLAGLMIILGLAMSGKGLMGVLRR